MDHQSHRVGAQFDVSWCRRHEYAVVQQSADGAFIRVQNMARVAIGYARRVLTPVIGGRRTPGVKLSMQTGPENDAADQRESQRACSATAPPRTDGSHSIRPDVHHRQWYKR